MRKISAILPVYNEETLLPLCLESIESAVDEIIVIDGGPQGPSKDKTAEIAQSFIKVKYQSGTYQTIPGAWDLASQKNSGLAKATGDVYLFLSADMLFYNLEYLCEVIKSEEEVKVFFCDTIEFWMDIRHIRLYSELDNLFIPGGVSEAVAIAKEAQPISIEPGSLQILTPKPKEQLLVKNTSKFHLGWIRPFADQVAKHIRHVRQGRWGEQGSNLMKGSEAKLEQWAISHVLTYRQNPTVEFRFPIAEKWKRIMEMNYLDGQSAYVKDFESRYGTSFFRSIKS